MGKEGILEARLRAGAERLASADCRGEALSGIAELLACALVKAEAEGALPEEIGAALAARAPRLGLAKAEATASLAGGTGAGYPWPGLH
jgi:hypothetical protein